MSKAFRIYFNEPWDFTIADDLSVPEGVVIKGPFSRPRGPKTTKGIGGIVPVISYLVFEIGEPLAVGLNMMLASEASADDDAQYVLRWIERHGRREFTKRDAQQHGKRRFPKADDIDPALAELTRRGYIRPKSAKTSGPGRPPSPSYEVNPAVFASADPQTRSHNSQIPPPRPEAGGSENIENALGRPKNESRVKVTI